MSVFKSGYVGIVGKPNVGKSTLLNRLLGQKIAITSPKPQTTRTRIQGVLTGENYQIIFIDTPGIHKPKDQLHQFMMREINKTVKEVDLILLMVELAETPDTDEQMAMDYLTKFKQPSILVINKIDLNRKSKLSEMVIYQNNPGIKDFIAISALKGTNCDELMKKIVDFLPLGPQYYPEDTLTDKTERFLIAELIREKVFELSHQEIPYSVAVVVEEVKERPDQMNYIKAVIYVEKDSQKGIIIGNNGQMLKKLGHESRKEIEILLEKRIYLDLWVKVKKNWRKNPNALREFGLEEK